MKSNRIISLLKCIPLFMIVCLLLLCGMFSCRSSGTISQKEVDLLQKRKAQIVSALNSTMPVIAMEKFENSDFKIVQDIFLKDERLKGFYEDPIRGEKLLNEVFSISDMRPGDVPQGLNGCSKESCKRIELYNYALNTAIVGIVNTAEKKLVHFAAYKETQPDVPQHLVDLAIYIAQHDTSVIREFGEDYQKQKALMPGTKTALNRTKCQRSRHLCLAPTFIKGEKALWAIVDLTDLNVAGVRWTHVGATGMAVTQRSAQNAKIMECFCDKANPVNRDGWSFAYMMTRSDGLQISNVRYNGRELFNSVKLVDWHVSYSKTEGFGYSDAVGCPEFSTAAVLAVEAPYFESIIEQGDTIGFLLGQHYFSEGWPMPCNYNYHQYYEFYKDGRFRPVMGSIGRGCGNNGVYRPVLRISISGTENKLYEWVPNGWALWEKEQWALHTEQKQLGADQQWFKIENNDGKGVVLLANTGQFRDHGRGDNAFVYATKQHADRDEGETDLPTIGPCCNTDYHQGPEKFIEGENIVNTPLVIWYVAQSQNDDRKGNEYCWAESVLKNGVYVPVIYPCYMGPMFKLL